MQVYECLLCTIVSVFMHVYYLCLCIFVNCYCSCLRLVFLYACDFPPACLRVSSCTMFRRLRTITIKNMAAIFYLSLLIMLMPKSSSAAGPWPGRWNGVWTQPPTRVPNLKSVDGPLLGDGEAGVVIGAARQGRDRQKDNEVEPLTHSLTHSLTHALTTSFSR